MGASEENGPSELDRRTDGEELVPVLHGLTVLDEDSYDFNEVIALIKDHEDELKAKGALRIDANPDWDAMTLEDISPDELEFLLQTFAVGGVLDEEAFVVAH